MDEVYKEGYEAFAKRLGPDNNPYADDSPKRAKWNDGWEDAKIDVDLDRKSICRENP